MSIRSEVVRVFNELLAGAKKISELPSATTPLGGTEEVEINQGGVSKKVAVSNFGGGGGGTVQSVTGNFVDNTDPANPVVNQEVVFVQVPTTPGTLILDFLNAIYGNFYGDASFASAKAVALTNDLQASRFNLTIEITNVAATLDFGAGSDFQSHDSRFNAATQVLTFPAVGTYTVHAYLGATNWWLEIGSGQLLTIGGTMSGNIAMGGNKVTGLAAATTSGDAMRFDEFTGFQDDLDFALILGFRNLFNF